MKYIIHKNHHSSNIWGFLPHFGFTFKNEISFVGKFDQSAIHDFGDNPDEYDISKFYGVSTSYYHHKQSARLGWRCIDNESIELLTYCYDKGSRLPEIVLGNVKPNESFKCTIKIREGFFDFIYEKDQYKKSVSIKKESKSWKFKYKLFPYFGGNLKAPHKMIMWIK